jgi:hypothetical protein
MVPWPLVVARGCFCACARLIPSPPLPARFSDHPTRLGRGGSCPASRWLCDRSGRGNTWDDQHASAGPSHGHCRGLVGPVAHGCGWSCQASCRIFYVVRDGDSVVSSQKRPFYRASNAVGETPRHLAGAFLLSGQKKMGHLSGILPPEKWPTRARLCAARGLPA